MSALTDVFTTIANAIRSKKGVSTTYKPSEMANAINSINGNFEIIYKYPITDTTLSVNRAYRIYDLPDKYYLSDIADYIFIKFKKGIDPSLSETSKYGEILIPTKYVRNYIYLALVGVGTSNKGTHSYSNYMRMIEIAYLSGSNPKYLEFTVYGPAKQGPADALQDNDTSNDAAMPVEFTLLKSKNITLYDPS